METQQKKLDFNAMRLFLLNNSFYSSKTQEKSKEINEFKLGDFLNKKRNK